ncbi:MAG: hypothetical protein HY762_05450 [Planctomycetes bacterium]|nr:hypothetical protein [Planctomycetota bacterium]
MRKIIAILTLMSMGLSVFGFPKGGGGGPSGPPPQDINWTKYDDALGASGNKQVMLVFLGTEKDRYTLTEKTKILATSEVFNMQFVAVILERDDLKIIKEIIANKPPADKPKREIEIAAKYKVTALPKVLGCDCYGSELQTVEPEFLKSAGKLDKLARELKDKQTKLETDLGKQYTKAEKSFDKEKEKNSFSPATIGDLQKIAKYTGYEPCAKAQSKLDEINKVADDEFNAAAGNAEADPKAALKELENIQKKYKGLPAGTKAEEKIKELKAPAAPLPKEEKKEAPKEPPK